LDNSGVIGYGVFPKFGPDAILMSILLYHFKELTECIEQVERIEAKANNKKKMGLRMNEEKEENVELLPRSLAPPRQLKLSEFKASG
jgi:hypothetical protein